ncbi:MAG: hypothetical protein U5K32_01705 [Bacteroidales bacterium]|nr:hypothetical protein [Bacteroidales bacterium]
MDFASRYLAAKAISTPLFEGIPEKDTAIIIIIPAFDEAGIIITLNSLLNCAKPPCSVELIVLLNAPGHASSAQLEQNDRTGRELYERERENSNSFIRLLWHDTGRMPPGWGVGMARKMAMDEALRRFSSIDKPEGVIVSLDADCTVSSAYLVELYERLYKTNHQACSVYFEHPLEGDMPADVYKAIIQYELHLRYYYRSLKYTGYPWVFHTLGSAIAVKAAHYARAGGMSKRTGAEDFYFIQKLVPAGGYFYLNTTVVKPSPRVSLRVPFGTGPAINSMLAGKQDDYMSYNPAAFSVLQQFFDGVKDYYSQDISSVNELSSGFNPGLLEFLKINSWQDKLRVIGDNTSSQESFVKRFFTWFNMFRIVKYLNFVHAQGYHERVPVTEAATAMLRLSGVKQEAQDAKELLTIYRQLER